MKCDHTSSSRCPNCHGYPDNLPMRRWVDYHYHQDMDRFKFPVETHWAKLNKLVPFWRDPDVWVLATMVVIVATLIILALK